MDGSTDTPAGGAVERDPEERLTRRDTARELGISLRRLHQLQRDGEITPEKNPATRHVRFRYADVAGLRLRRSAFGPLDDTAGGAR